jgi:hypothetical protein
MYNFKLIIVAISLALLACGQSNLEGIYVANIGGKEVNFLAFKNGKAGIFNVPSEMSYEIIGKDVKIHGPMGPVILKINDDGSIDFPGIGNLKKNSSK